MCLKWSFLWLVMATISAILVLLMPAGGLTREDLPRKRIVYTVPGMETVEVQQDIFYKQADGSDLKMDVYLPPAQARSNPLPGVLLLHGGPLPPSVSAKDWGIFVSY